MFFQELVDTLRKEHSFTEVSEAKPHGWCELQDPVEGIHYTASFQPRRKEAWVEVMHRKARKGVFDQLMEHRSAIESELGESLNWKEQHAGGSCIAAHRPGTIDDDEETLAEIRAWMVERLLRFRQVFGPRLDELVV